MLKTKPRKEARYLIRLFAALTTLVGIVRSPAAYGATLNALSCSQADVQAAVNAAADGDTVRVPAGRIGYQMKIHIPAGIFARLPNDSRIAAGKNLSIFKPTQTTVGKRSSACRAADPFDQDLTDFPPKFDFYIPCYSYTWLGHI